MSSSGVAAAHRKSAATLAGWFEAHRDLLRGLAALRHLGSVGDEAVTQVMNLPEIRTIVPSWQLWRALAYGDGVDPDLLLAEMVPRDFSELARFALGVDGAR